MLAPETEPVSRRPVAGHTASMDLKGQRLAERLYQILFALIGVSAAGLPRRVRKAHVASAHPGVAPSSRRFRAGRGVHLRIRGAKL